MKKVFLSSYGICAILVAALLYSCNKDKDEDTKSNRILGLWNIIRETEINQNTTTGKYTDTASSDPIAPGLFTAEFKSNGKVYININDNSPSKDTFDWHFHNDSTLMIDKDYHHLDVFTSNHMIAIDYYWDNTDSVKHILEFTK
jgi:hypothetical protein